MYEFNIGFTGIVGISEVVGERDGGGMKERLTRVLKQSRTKIIYILCFYVIFLCAFFE